ncbi:MULTISPECIES: ATP-dependent DNA ligase [Microbacterium]|uniref:ATP-dependent DNA ligase n=1 Tax=Microbacterium TaxID=33882 RepID=UPI000F5EDA2C|nr:MULTISPECIES: ATP-dependent DNA ligase [Microbacterium]AZH77857.1 ATP-dependent DNA ligase [Microbacterium sp. Y-01]MDX2401422.1 ATP-dependent DNA ligase [Microbacterium algeriense]
MLLSELVTTTDHVAATSSRLAKIDAIARLLDGADEGDVAALVGLLLAAPRQGRLGIGWRGLAALDIAHAEEPSLTIADVDHAFDELATTSGAGSAGVRSDLLRGLASRATAAEWDFLARAMLGELRTGALSGVLLDAVARAADAPIATVRRAAMLSGDLGETARIALTGGDGDLDAIGLRVGRPVLPMLAATAATPTAALEITGTASVEYKLDGARIQVHRHGDEVGIFTRSLADVTHRLPEIVDIVRTLPADDLILDGETLALDEEGGPRPFQETMSRFGADVARELALRPWFFDVLHVDGRDLIDEPLSVRQEVLDRIAGEWRMPGVVTDSADEAERLSREALAAGHEGVLVKSIDAPYAAGRRGKSWVKVKPVLTFDLVVLGAEWGSGRRRGWLSNLHLGARDPEGEFGDPGSFVMVGKTFKGLTDELLRWQTAEFPAHETHRTASTVFLRPELVVEIAIDGVQRSPRYPGGIALRFARVKGYRSDKSPAEADTIQTLRALLRG